jgi:hypothetical protein
MEIINNHVIPKLRNNLCQNDHNFNELFSSIKEENKLVYRDILFYLNLLLDNSIYNKDEKIYPLHIHFSYDLDSGIKDLIAEFLLIKNHKSTLENNSLLLESIDSEVQVLINRIMAFCYPAKKSREYPYGLNTIEYNKVINTHKKNTSLLKFYKSVGKKLKFNLLFNSTVNQISTLRDKFYNSYYAVDLNDKIYSSNLLNSEYSLNDMDYINSDLVDGLNTVILFDAERKTKMIEFSLNELSKWKEDFGSNFKKIIIISFGRNSQSINAIKNKLELVKNRFHFPANSSYTILNSEIEFILNKKIESTVPKIFIGQMILPKWQFFLTEVGINSLYELRSIKLLNVYSICINEEIKKYIVDDIFSNLETSELVSSTTKQSILELREDVVEFLKDSLSNILDEVIKSNLEELVKYDEYIILDDAIIRNSRLSKLIIQGFSLKDDNYIKMWSELNDIHYGSVIILSYRDQGKYPNYFYPNLLEFQSRANVKAILQSLFFGNQYKWAEFNLYKDYHKNLYHSFRNSHFGWNELNEVINSIKPEAKINIDWELENEYSYSDHREGYKVKLTNHKSKLYHSSDLVIYNEIKINNPRIERIKWVYENLDFEDSEFEIQKLDELLDEFNPAEKLIDTSKQEDDLIEIRKELGLSNESAGRIWKTLLNRKLESNNLESLYVELKTLFDMNDIPLVSLNHFRNTWLNIDSDSLVPRGNKVFRILCDYLGLKSNYRLILYRLKNISISGKIEATKKYSRLLKDLFSDGCFNISDEYNKDVITNILLNRIQYYIANHVFDELGIDNEKPIMGLLTLIELIQPEIKLSKIETIEKIE